MINSFLIKKKSFYGVRIIFKLIFNFEDNFEDNFE